MSSRIKRTLILLIACTLCGIAAWYIGAHNYLSLSSLKTNKNYLECAVVTNYPKSVLIYLLIYISIIGLALPGVPLLTMVGGYFFGFIPATIYALVGATIGTTISFLVIRYLLAGIILGKYAERLERFNEKINAYGTASYLLTLQIIGLVPYFVINVLAALAHVPFVTFLWTTCVGSLPILCIYAFAGKQLYTINSVNDVFSPSIIGLLIVLVILALIPLFLKFSRRVTDL